MAKLTTDVVIRNPETGEPTHLPPGMELPEWAEDLVGEHALDTDDEEPKAKARESDAPDKSGPKTRQSAAAARRTSERG